MSLLPYTLIEPTGGISPLLVDSPHSGRVYPVDFAYACPLPLLRQAEDAYMDEVIAGAAQAGATVVLAEFPRSMIDANRGESDIDPAVVDGVWPQPLTPAASGFGLIRRLCRNGISMYCGPLSIAEIERRIALYYRPYHACLSAQIAARIAKFGSCIFIDAHSMPDYVDNGAPRADFVLGDRDGSSCAPALTLRAQQILQSMGYSVAVNFPYKGREIVRRYGLSGQGAQALQMEVNRKLYLNENLTEKHSGFERLRHNMTVFFQKLAAAISVDIQERQAAE